MPHKITAAFIGEGELLPAVVRAVLAENVVENIVLAESDAVCKESFANADVSFCTDEVNAVVKSEFVVACASKKRELGTVLAPIAGCTRGRILIALCPGVDVAYITERVAKGTEILAVPLECAEDGTYHASMEFSHGFLPFQVEPCRDIISSFCTLDDVVSTDH